MEVKSMLITFKEVQDILGISRPHMYELLKEGMPYIAISERVKRFEIDKVMDWLKDRQNKAAV